MRSRLLSKNLKYLRYYSTYVHNVFLFFFLHGVYPFRSLKRFITYYILKSFRIVFSSHFCFLCDNKVCYLIMNTQSRR